MDNFTSSIVAQLENNLTNLREDDLNNVTERMLVQQVCTQMGIDPSSLDAVTRQEVKAMIAKFVQSWSAAPTPMSQQPLAKRVKGSGGKKHGSPDPSPGIEQPRSARRSEQPDSKWAEPRRAKPVKEEGGGDGGGGGGALSDRILAHLSALPADAAGVDAARIAASLKAQKSEVNKLLYGMERSRSVFKTMEGTKPLWRVNPGASASGGFASPASGPGGGGGGGGGGGSAPSLSVELGGKKRLTVSDFGGRWRVDLREWYEKDGEMKPGAKGISLPKEQWDLLVRHLGDIDGALGLGGRGGGAADVKEEEEQEEGLVGPDAADWNE